MTNLEYREAVREDSAFPELPSITETWTPVRRDLLRTWERVVDDTVLSLATMEKGMKSEVPPSAMAHTVKRLRSRLSTIQKAMMREAEGKTRNADSHKGIT